MDKITFRDLPNTTTPINASNLNQVQTNVENAINLKQNTLSAGSNVTIDNDTISATDTTYNNATTSVSGLMSYSDKALLDNLSNYSTTEKAIGKWIDGSTIYRKVVNFGALANNDTKTVPHGISNLNYFVSIRGFAFNPTTRITIPIPYTTSGSNNGTQIYVDGTNITIQVPINYSSYSTCYIILDYIKV